MRKLTVDRVSHNRRDRHIARDWKRQGPTAILIVLLVVLALGGGASRINVVSLMFVRPALVLATGALLFFPVVDAAPNRNARFLMWLLGLFAVVIAVQLVPLPPGVWQMLPGHQVYAEVARIEGVAQPWRPISIVPVLTLNSLTTLLAPLAFFMAVRRIPYRQTKTIILALVVVAIATCIMGAIQTAGGDRSAAYLYRYAKPGFAPGLFANRNHQAAFLAAMLPLTTAWALMPRQARDPASRRLWIAGSAGALFMLLIIMTASRTGLGLAAIGLFVSAWMMQRSRRKQQRPTDDPDGRSWKRWLLAIAFVAGVASIIALPFLTGRTAVLERLTSGGNDASAVLRIAALPITVDLMGRFFPLGSGFGTFDTAFRAVEPDRLLAPGYFNNAHNDLIELAITGGVPSVLLLLALCGWLGKRAVTAFGRRTERSASLVVTQGSLAFLTIILLASLSDYPLRTPLLAGMFGLVAALATRRGFAQAVKEF